MPSCHNILTLISSILITRATFSGTSKPYLKRFFRTRAFTPAMILSLFLRTYEHHQANAGSSMIYCIVAYLATRTGYATFMLESRSQDVKPSLHSTHSFHPTLVFLGNCWPLMTTYQYDLETTLSLDLWSTISEIRRYWFPASLHLENIFYAITFAVNSATSLSGKSTSYERVSRIGFGFLVPNNSTSESLACRLTYP